MEEIDKIFPPLKYEKRYVRMQVMVSEDGEQTPICFEWNGRRVDIDRVIEVIKRQPRNVGGCPSSCLEHKCRVLGKMRLVYYDIAKNAWFVEAKVGETQEPDGDLV